jgi:hypothetical protein
MIVTQNALAVLTGFVDDNGNVGTGCLQLDIAYTRIGNTVTAQIPGFGTNEGILSECFVGGPGTIPTGFAPDFPASFVVEVFNSCATFPFQAGLIQVDIDGSMAVLGDAVAQLAGFPAAFPPAISLFTGGCGFSQVGIVSTFLTWVTDQ